VTEKKKFLLRLDAELYDALEKWAADDLRSVNAEMEFLLKEAVRKAGRRNQENGELSASAPEAGPAEAPNREEGGSA
jgi:hypothetical protein